MTRIFISYRRDDSKRMAQAIHKQLCEAFEGNNVFLDTESIQPGQPWPEKLRFEVDHSEVMLVLIGKNWLNIKDSIGKRRLDDPEDWVRKEIVQGLARPSLRLIPILISNTKMPRESDLPDELKEILRRNFVQIRQNYFYFSYDIKKLIDKIKGGTFKSDGYQENKNNVDFGMAPLIVALFALIIFAIIALVALSSFNL